MKTFQTAILLIFGALALIGVLVFATVSNQSSGGIGAVAVWGTLPKDSVDSLLAQIETNRHDFDQVRYTYIDPALYEQKLLEGFASGTGPDLFLVPQESLLAQTSHIAPIGYSTLSQRAFKDRFVQEGELYLKDSGALALPLTIDPLVLYWNRDMLANGGIAKPPSFWDELVTLAPKLSVRDSKGTVTQSAIALGEYRNITNAKAILSALFMQAGDSIVSRDADGNPYASLAAENSSLTSAGPSAIRFYTQFANPINTIYSWNRALPESQKAFLAGSLAFYVGFASEAAGLRAQNPNLNFDVAPLPQTRDIKNKLTYGAMQAISVPKTTHNLSGATAVALELVSDANLAYLADKLGLPPVSRADLSSQPPSAAQQVFYASALIARGWLDPAPEKTNTIFQDMIEGVTSGKFEISDALSRASLALDELLRGNQ